MLNELIEISDSLFNPAVETWKEQGKKVVGFLCSFVPEEVLYAADVLPYRIRATGCKKFSEGDLWMSNYSCSFARSCLELALDGTFGFLDGLVALDSCAQIERLYDNWRFKAGLPFMHLLNLPYKNSQAAITWYRDEIEMFMHRTEEAFGVTVSEEDLVRVIGVYNETRSLLRELYELRKSDNPPVTGLQSQRLVMAAMSMPREQYNRLLRASMDDIRSGEPTSKARPRFMVVGSALDEPAFIEIVEDQGALVVTDALCFGSRYFWKPVSMDGDPLLALSASYLSRPKCPRMMNQHESLLAFIVDMVQEFNVDGIIFQKLKFCNLWGGESLFLERNLKRLKIPFLSIGRDHNMNRAAQIGTRVQAFIEMIEGVGA